MIANMEMVKKSLEELNKNGECFVSEKSTGAFVTSELRSNHCEYKVEKLNGGFKIVITAINKETEMFAV